MVSEEMTLGELVAACDADAVEEREAFRVGSERDADSWVAVGGEHRGTARRSIGPASTHDRADRGDGGLHLRRGRTEPPDAA